MGSKIQLYAEYMSVRLRARWFFTAGGIDAFFAYYAQRWPEGGEETNKTLLWTCCPAARAAVRLLVIIKVNNVIAASI